ncbi:MAG: hypothetical protein ACK4UN_14755 [Limisphaerales bacterium]
MSGKKIFIQNRATRQFLRGTNRWVDAASEAKRFQSALQAYDFAVTNQIPDVEIVFQQSSKIESVLSGNRM